MTEILAGDEWQNKFIADLKKMKLDNFTYNSICRSVGRQNHCFSFDGQLLDFDDWCKAVIINYRFDPKKYSLMSPAIGEIRGLGKVGQRKLVKAIFDAMAPLERRELLRNEFRKLVDQFAEQNSVEIQSIGSYITENTDTYPLNVLVFEIEFGLI